MKRLIPFALTILFAYSSARAQDTHYATTIVEMREAPSTEASILHTIPKGGRVRTLECTDGWCHCYYSILEGYVSERYLAQGTPPVVETETRERKEYRSSRQRSHSVQCSGTTKKGARCRRMTTNASGRCYQH